MDWRENQNLFLFITPIHFVSFSAMKSENIPKAHERIVLPFMGFPRIQKGHTLGFDLPEDLRVVAVQDHLRFALL